MSLYADTYPYVGPEEIRRAAASHPEGTRVDSVEDIEAWLHQNPDALTEGATYVVAFHAVLKLAPRRSEHVACAGGREVLAAGEIRFQRTGTGLEVASISNQSTGYCPDVSCWPVARLALLRSGLGPPEGFSPDIVFRRCTRCGEINLVKDAWFVCVFCDADLPAEWNVATRGKVELLVPG